MEKIIKQHITEHLEDTKVYFKYKGIYFISKQFINGIATTFSISDELVMYYLNQLVPKFVLDINNDVMRAYHELPEVFERNNSILDVIADLKLTKSDYVAVQNYHMAAYYRDYEKSLEKAVTNKWDAWTKYMNERTD